MRKMKKSKIPFCKEIPADWTDIPNKYIFYNHSIKVGENSSKYQLLSLTTNGVREKDINKGGGKVPDSYDNYQTVEKGDMIFCLFDLDCSAVFSGLSNYNGMITSAYDVLKANNSIADSHYLDYWFQYVFSNRYYKIFSKNIRYSVTGDMFKSIYTPLPPIIQQERIGNILDDKCSKVDTLITNQQSQIEKLKSYKQSLITETINPQKKWNKCRLGQISSFKNGLNYNGNINNETIRFLGVGDFQQNFIMSGEEMFSVLNFDGNVPEDLLLKDNDIVFVRSNGSKELVGRSVLIKDVNFPLTYSGFCIRMRNNREDLIISDFLMYYFLSNNYRQNLNKNSRGTNITNLNQEMLSALEIYYPSLENQKEIVEYLNEKTNSIDNLISLKQQKIEKLQQYKKSLIYEYVTGKKEVK